MSFIQKATDLLNDPRIYVHIKVLEAMLLIAFKKLRNCLTNSEWNSQESSLGNETLLVKNVRLIEKATDLLIYPCTYVYMKVPKAIICAGFWKPPSFFNLPLSRFQAPLVSGLESFRQIALFLKIECWITIFFKFEYNGYSQWDIFQRSMFRMNSSNFRTKI